MAPRSSWKGFIKLSLVSVPVKAFTASNTSESIRLNQLHKDCNARVQYKKVCAEHGDLKTADIVSGYEYAKGEYVVIDPEELAQIRLQSDRSIGIEGFVDEASIDPHYYSGKSYFLLPDGVAGNRPYALLARGMEEAGVLALAEVVMSRRQQLVVLRADNGLLMMNMISYGEKLKSEDTFRTSLGDVETSDDEMGLAKTLIDASKIEKFDINEYKDAYAGNLTSLIQMKLDGKQVVQVSEPEAPKIVNLMEALKQSVAEAQAGQRKMAPSVKEPAKAKTKTSKKTG